MFERVNGGLGQDEPPAGEDSDQGPRLTTHVGQPVPDGRNGGAATPGGYRELLAATAGRWTVGEQGQR
jgi:hypothetical protein